MAGFVKGNIVVTPFPFSDLSQQKRRPALVIASLKSGSFTDYLLCMITSQQTNDPFAIRLLPAHFQEGGLDRESYVRPGYVFTAEDSLLGRRIGSLQPAVLGSVIDTIRQIIEPESHP